MKSNPSAICLVAYADDPLEHVARQLLADHAGQLPDLTGATVLLAEPHAGKRLRRHLLKQAQQQGYPALLLPRFTSIRDWLTRQYHKYHQPALPVCTPHQRELILFDALSQHRSLLGSGSPWHLAHDLLQLFDQLTANLQTLPDDYSRFEQLVADAYGIDSEAFPALGQEARLVFTLWHAWYQQLQAENLIDHEAACLLGMQADLQHNSNRLYIAGYHQFTLAEQQWLETLQQQQRCCLYLHGRVAAFATDDSQSHPDRTLSKLLQQLEYHSIAGNETERSHFLEQVYSTENIPLQQRAQHAAALDADAIRQQLQLLFAKSDEQQAHAVELQVRRWLLQGKQRIGIVTENRRLARRVRALLERADIPLQDYAGWALSTTRAAAVLERWLQCIEEDFLHSALLDLLKSPFVFSDLDHQAVKQATYRLEHDIIRQENVARSLRSYQHSIRSRAKRLQWSNDVTALLQHLLQVLDKAGRPLLALLHGTHPAHHYTQALLQSLADTGMLPLLQQDAAGCRVVEMLETLHHSASNCTLSFHWHDFRTWLGRSLESFVFIPEQTDSPVSLMGLGQSRLQKFDALIIASAEQQHLPGKMSQTPFFNNAVRAQLGISTHQDLVDERFHHFRRLLESADEVLITANNESNGETVPISPWLELLHRFYQQSHGSTLEDQVLQSLLQQGSYVIRCSDMSLPETSNICETTIPKELIPQRYSPSSYQKLINCPYQFFASYALQLSPSEAVQEALSKNDYGERVHRCLQAFHYPVDELPPPFAKPLDEQNRQQAIAHLQHISKQVFATDVDDNFEHRGWLQQWLKLIPEYIDWQIRHHHTWKFAQAELHAEQPWHDNILLHGRLDRIDRNGEALGIIDYKTGGFARTEDIASGESVQLPFYAWLAEMQLQQPVQQVGYLELNRRVKMQSLVAGEQLQELTSQIADRLQTIHEQMQQGARLKAWGDSQTCKYCEMQRLCRKQA